MSRKHSVPVFKIVALVIVGNYISVNVTEWILGHAGLPPPGPDTPFWAVTLTKIGVGSITMIPYIFMVWYLVRRRASRDKEEAVLDDSHIEQ